MSSERDFTVKIIENTEVLAKCEAPNPDIIARHFTSTIAEIAEEFKTDPEQVVLAGYVAYFIVVPKEMSFVEKCKAALILKKHPEAPRFAMITRAAAKDEYQPLLNAIFEAEE